MLKMVFGIVALAMTAGCGGGSVQDDWESAGAITGRYDFDGMEVLVKGRKPSAESIPCFWAHTEFDFGRLGTLPVPPKPFGLHFGGSKLTDSHLGQLSRFRTADYLGLNNTRITNAGLARLSAFENINALDLGRTAVGDEGMNSISKLPNLKTLILSSAHVSDTGAETLSRMKTLEALDISHTAVTDDGLKNVASLPNLRYLGVIDTQATPDGIAAVKKQYPDLEVVDRLD